MKEQEDIPTKFWKKWTKAEEEKQIEMVKKMLITRTLAEYFQTKIKIKVRKSFFINQAARIVNDIFLDLYHYLKNDSKLEKFK